MTMTESQERILLDIEDILNQPTMVAEGWTQERPDDFTSLEREWFAEGEELSRLWASQWDEMQ